MRGTNKITKLRNLVVREVSFVNNPAIPDAKFVIVKEAEEAPKVEVEIEKSPVQSGTASLEAPGTPLPTNEVLDDGGKAELAEVVKQLVDKASGLPDGMKDLVAKIAKFHGIDPYTPEMLEAAKPKDPAPMPAPVGGADTPSTTKEAAEVAPVTMEQIRSLFTEMMEAARPKVDEVALNKSDPDPVPEEPETVPAPDADKGSDPQIDILLRAAELLKEEEDNRLQLAELETLNAQREALNTSVCLLKTKSQELRRELLKAMGKDPNENSVIA